MYPNFASCFSYLILIMFYFLELFYFGCLFLGNLNIFNGVSCRFRGCPIAQWANWVDTVKFRLGLNPWTTNRDMDAWGTLFGILPRIFCECQSKPWSSCNEARCLGLRVSTHAIPVAFLGTAGIQPKAPGHLITTPVSCFRGYTKSLLLYDELWCFMFDLKFEISVLLGPGIVGKVGCSNTSVIR